MDLVNDIFFFYDVVFSEDTDEILFGEVAVDIVGDVAALGGNHELLPFVAFFFDQVVQNCIDHLLRLAKTVESAGVEHIDSSRFDAFHQSSEHFVVVLI